MLSCLSYLAVSIPGPAEAPSHPCFEGRRGQVGLSVIGALCPAQHAMRGTRSHSPETQNRHMASLSADPNQVFYVGCEAVQKVRAPPGGFSLREPRGWKRGLHVSPLNTILQRRGEKKEIEKKADPSNAN